MSNDPNNVAPDEPRHQRKHWKNGRYEAAHCGSFLPHSGWNWEEDEWDGERFIVWFIDCPRCGQMIREEH